MPSNKHNGIWYKYLTTNLILYSLPPAEKLYENLVYCLKTSIKEPYTHNI